MLDRLHEHVVSELHQGARTDTVFVVTAVAFNLVVLAINWNVADPPYNRPRPVSTDWILGVLIAVTLLINIFAVRALAAGKKTRLALLAGLVQMYRDQGIDRYYDASLLENYAARYRMFTAVIVALAAVSIGVPLCERLLG
jgi:hypothetical protein